MKVKIEKKGQYPSDNFRTVRVSPELYEKLLKRKHQMEMVEGHHVSFSDVLEVVVKGARKSARAAS